jgi:hypothetical protein
VVSLITGRGDRRTGVVYGYDRRNSRIIELDKATGAYRAQYRLAGGVAGWDDVRGMYIQPPTDTAAAPILIWISRDSINQVVLEAVPDVAPATPAPSSGPSGSPAGASPQPATQP